MIAKYYIYRNLRTNTFSVRHKGKVIARPSDFIAHDVVFRVNDKGRKKVLLDKRKNAHAFIVCSSWKKVYHIKVNKIERVTYSPYIHTAFMHRGNKISSCNKVVGINGKDIYMISNQVGEIQ